MLRPLLLAAGALPSPFTHSSPLPRSLVPLCRAPKSPRLSARSPAHTGRDRDHDLGVRSALGASRPCRLLASSPAALKAAPSAHGSLHTAYWCVCPAGTAWTAHESSRRARARVFVTACIIGCARAIRDPAMSCVRTAAVASRTTLIDPRSSCPQPVYPGRVCAA